MRSSGLALIQYPSYPYEKEKFKHRDRHVQKEDDEDSSHATMESGLDVASLNQEMPKIASKPPEARTVSLTGTPSEETNPDDPGISDLQLPEPWDNKSLSSKSPSLRYLLAAGSLSKLIHRARRDTAGRGGSPKGAGFLGWISLGEGSEAGFSVSWRKGFLPSLWPELHWGMGKAEVLPLVVDVHQLLWLREAGWSEAEPRTVVGCGCGCVLFSVLYFPSVTSDPRKVWLRVYSCIVRSDAPHSGWRIQEVNRRHQKRHKCCPGAPAGPWMVFEQGNLRGMSLAHWRWPFGKCLEISGRILRERIIG